MKKKLPPRPPTAESLNQLSKEELVELVWQMWGEIERLQRIILGDSQTTSKPPSSDLIKKSEKKPEATALEKEGKRKPGGQRGHQGTTKKGFGRVDKYSIIKAEECECGHRYFCTQKIETQQVAQLVEKPIETIEYQRHHCQCLKCGQMQTPKWPDEVVPGQSLGIRLQALLTWLGSWGHLSYEKQQELLKELGLEISTGTLVATTERVSRAALPTVTELKEWVQQTQPNIHVDETPWPVMGTKEWLWVISHPQFVLFHAGDTRSRAELVSMIGDEYAGVLSSDDYSVYNGYPAANQQKCLAHLRRNCLSLMEQPGQLNREIGQGVKELIDEAFKRYGEWQVDHDGLMYRLWAQEFRRRMQSLLEQWWWDASDAGRCLLRRLREKPDEWWYFLEHPEVPPDNNCAERALRLGVTKRKVCGGSREMEWFGRTGVLLSVIQTCRRSGRSVLSFLTEALMAFHHQLLH